MSKRHLEDLLESAWGIIANVSDGNWYKQNADWCKAASDWRDEYHGTLPNTRHKLLILKSRLLKFFNRLGVKR